ncbi:MAG: DUF192 domain-containing protein, partial [Chloroflexi bacterium]|nr:DUF192 domain-containing protein [Chloroflexota bacterium]
MAPAAACFAWIWILLVAIIGAACAPSQTATFPLENVTVQGLPGRPIEPDWVDYPDCAAASKSPLTTRELTLHAGSRQIELTVEVAATALERQQGLMCRKSVAPGTGMLFLFGNADLTGGFWMFNTYAPLDLLYVDSGGKMVAAVMMTPCPRRVSEADADWAARCATDSAPYAPGRSYRTALELPAGWLASQGLD